MLSALLPRLARALDPWLILGAALLTLGAVLAATLYRDYVAVEASQTERLASQARIVADNLDNRLGAIYQTLAAIREQSAAWTTDAGRKTASRRLQTLGQAMLAVRTLMILDAKGTVIASSREQLIGMDFSGREYFQTARSGGDPAVLYVSPPYTTVLGGYVISLTRVTLDAKGEFSGIVTTALDPSYFSVLLDSIRYAPDMWTALAHGGGRQFLMQPQREGMAGLDLATPVSFFGRHRASGETATVGSGRVYATGEERMVALRSISPAAAHMDQPLVVTVSRDLAAVFAGWRREAAWETGSFAIFVLASTQALFFYQRRRRARDSLSAERRQAADLLMMSEDRYRDVVLALSEGVVAHARDGSITTWNPAAERILGLTGDELRGRTYFDSRWQVIREDGMPLPAEAHPALEALRTGVRQKDMVMGVRKPDGSLTWISLNAVPTFGAGDPLPHGVVVSFADISELKRAAEELARHRYRLEDLVASRTAELTTAQGRAEAAHKGKSRFLAAASHDLRQPLFAAQLFIDRLAMTLPEGEQQSSAKKVQQALKTMSGELRLLLELSRLDDGAFVIDKHDQSTIALFELLSDTYAMKARKAYVRLLFHPGEFVLHTDSGLLARLLGNLIDNAIKFSPGGTVLVCARRSRGGHLLQVRDNGRGIAKSDHAAIFDDFYQVANVERDPAAGYGLGLSIVGRIAGLLGSKLQLASTVGRGSTFSLVVPSGQPDSRLRSLP